MPSPKKPRPPYRLHAVEGGFMEFLRRYPTREACYAAALADEGAEYLILIDGDGPDSADREIWIDDAGTLRYRIPGTGNWHEWTP